MLIRLKTSVTFILLLWLTGCACQCHITESKRNVSYLCDNQNLTVSYINSGKRIDESQADITFNHIMASLFLSVKGFGKNYFSQENRPILSEFQNQPIQSIHWQSLDNKGTLNIITTKNQFTFNCTTL